MDPIQTAISEIANLPDLHPETKTLLALAAEAQRTGKMPEIPEADDPDVVYSHWSGRIYPCSEGCGFIGRLDAFTHGDCYDPCPRCGAHRKRRLGRFVYRLEPRRWLPFLKRKVFVRVQWRDELNSQG